MGREFCCAVEVVLFVRRLPGELDVDVEALLAI